MEPAPRPCQTKDCARPRRVRYGLGRDFPVGAFSWACCSHCARGTHDVNGATVHSAACNALAVLLPPAPAPVPTPTPLAPAPSAMHATDALPAPPPRNLRARPVSARLQAAPYRVRSGFDYCTASHAIRRAPSPRCRLQAGAMHRFRPRSCRPADLQSGPSAAASGFAFPVAATDPLQRLAARGGSSAAKARGRSRPWHRPPHHRRRLAGAYGGTRPDAAATSALACAGTAVACATAARQSAATLHGALPRRRRRQCRGSSFRQRPCRACAGAKPACSLLDPGVQPSTDDVARRSSDFLRRPSLLRALWSGAARGRCHGRRTRPHAGLRHGRGGTAAATAPGCLRPRGAAAHGGLARQCVNFLQ